MTLVVTPGGDGRRRSRRLGDARLSAPGYRAASPSPSSPRPRPSSAARPRRRGPVSSAPHAFAIASGALERVAGEHRGQEPGVERVAGAGRVERVDRGAAARTSRSPRAASAPSARLTTTPARSASDRVVEARRCPRCAWPRSRSAGRRRCGRAGRADHRPPDGSQLGSRRWWRPARTRSNSAGSSGARRLLQEVGARARAERVRDARDRSGRSAGRDRPRG